MTSVARHFIESANGKIIVTIPAALSYNLVVSSLHVQCKD